VDNQHMRYCYRETVRTETRCKCSSHCNCSWTNQ